MREALECVGGMEGRSGGGFGNQRAVMGGQGVRRCECV